MLCLYTSESDVYRRQILTYKVGPCAERVKACKRSAMLAQHLPIFFPYCFLDYINSVGGKRMTHKGYPTTKGRSANGAFVLGQRRRR